MRYEPCPSSTGCTSTLIGEMRDLTELVEQTLTARGA